MTQDCQPRMIECEGLIVAVTAEADEPKEHPIYYPANAIVYVEQGTLRLKVDNQIFYINEGEFALVRKYTYGIYYKTWEDTQNGFRDHVFVLEDKFIKDVINNFHMPEDFMPCTIPMVKLPGTPLLLGLMKSIKAYVTGQAQIDRKLIRIKTMEAIHAISSVRPDL